MSTGAGLGMGLSLSGGADHRNPLGVGRRLDPALAPRRHAGAARRPRIAAPGDQSGAARGPRRGGASP